MAKWEKMSKSRGNVVLPEEVVYGVYEYDSKNWEFRLPNGDVIDPGELGVWRDKLRTGFYFTATRYRRMPIFLHEKNNPVPSLLLIDGEEKVQHPDLVNFWGYLHEKYGEPEPE